MCGSEGLARSWSLHTQQVNVCKGMGDVRVCPQTHRTDPRKKMLVSHECSCLSFTGNYDRAEGEQAKNMSGSHSLVRIFSGSKRMYHKILLTMVSNFNQVTKLLLVISMTVPISYVPSIIIIIDNNHRVLGVTYAHTVT